MDTSVVLVGNPTRPAKQTAPGLDKVSFVDGIKMVQKSVLLRSSPLHFFRSVPQIQNDVGNCIICPISGNEISETPSSSYGTRFKRSQFKLQMDI